MAISRLTIPRLGHKKLKMRLMSNTPWVAFILHVLAILKEKYTVYGFLCVCLFFKEMGSLLKNAVLILIVLILLSVPDFESLFFA